MTRGQHDGTVSRPNAAPGRTGRPPVTSRAQILAAARQVIDVDGWEKLTIRRLATEMGIGATTLYHHVRNKEELLLLLLNEYLIHVPRPELPSDPRERIIVAMTVGHDALAAWPWAAEALTADGFIALLDEDALWMVDEILRGLIEYGCTPEHTVAAFRALWYYTVGEILVRAHTARRPADTPFPDREKFLANLDATRLPHLALVAGHWATVVESNTYPDGLRAVVDGLLAEATATKP